MSGCTYILGKFCQNVSKTFSDVNVVLDEFSPLVEIEPGLPNRNINMAKDIKRATAYSYFRYVFLNTIHSIEWQKYRFDLPSKTGFFVPKMRPKALTIVAKISENVKKVLIQKSQM